MTSLSFRDMETLSAFLDGEISPAEKTRLENRIQSDPKFAAAVEEMRQTRILVHSIPQRRAPRNFTLTPQMAGIRPPVPRLVPVFSWASAAAMLLFIFTLGTSLVKQFSFGTASPMQAAAPMGLGGGPPSAATVPPVIAAPATMAPATLAPAPLRTNQAGTATATPEAEIMSVPQVKPGTTSDINPRSAQKAQRNPLNPWLVIWAGAGVILGIIAVLVWWLNQRAFHRKNPPE